MKTSEEWYESSMDEVRNMTIEEAKAIIIESFERNIAHTGERDAARPWFAKAMELVLPIIKGEDNGTNSKNEF